jgi:hypothetical protein
MTMPTGESGRPASLTVVNVLSAGRSGSTVLATLLGQFPWRLLRWRAAAAVGAGLAAR